MLVEYDVGVLRIDGSPFHETEEECLIPRMTVQDEDREFLLSENTYRVTIRREASFQIELKDIPSIINEVAWELRTLSSIEVRVGTLSSYLCPNWELKRYDKEGFLVGTSRIDSPYIVPVSMHKYI